MVYSTQIVPTVNGDEKNSQSRSTEHDRGKGQYCDSNIYKLRVALHKILVMYSLKNKTYTFLLSLSNITIGNF